MSVGLKQHRARTLSADVNERVNAGNKFDGGIAVNDEIVGGGLAQNLRDIKRLPQPVSGSARLGKNRLMLMVESSLVQMTIVECANLIESESRGRPQQVTLGGCISPVCVRNQPEFHGALLKNFSWAAMAGPPQANYRKTEHP
jgi:hypothetical protein